MDAAALGRYLQGKLDGDWRGIELKQFVNGQSNPTFLIAAGKRSYVLRKRPPGPLLPSAHAIDREYHVIGALRETGLPVPATRLYCADEGIVGTAFFIMDYVAGRVFRDPLLPALSPTDRARACDSMNATIAALHNVDVDSIGLADFGRPGNYYERQISRWTQQYRASETDTIPAMEELIDWLPRHLPEDTRVRLIHGDFRLENLIFHPVEPRVIAVLDWELSTLGDPLGDLAYNCLPWHLPPAAFGGLVGVDLADSGLPTEADYLAAYCQRTKRVSLRHWHFYVAFAAFRLAAILQGVLKRALNGNASSPDAVRRGRLAPVCAMTGLRAIERQERPLA